MRPQSVEEWFYGPVEGYDRKKNGKKDYISFCKALPRLRKLEYQYFVWQKRAIPAILTKLAPKIGESKPGRYNERVKRLGRLLERINLVVQFSASHYEKTDRNLEMMMLTQWATENLFKEVFGCTEKEGEDELVVD